MLNQFMSANVGADGECVWVFHKSRRESAAKGAAGLDA